MTDDQMTDDQMTDEKMTDAQMLDMIRDAVTGGITLKDAHGISDEMMAGLYAYAYDFYGKGQLDEAEKFFRFLCLYDFYNLDYVMGLAAVYQLKKQYEKAIGLYAVAFGMSKNDYRPMFFTGQCHLFSRKASKARQCFELVVKHGNDDAFRTKAQAYVDVLTRSQAAPGVEDEPDADAEVTAGTFN